MPSETFRKYIDSGFDPAALSILEQQSQSNAQQILRAFEVWTVAQAQDEEATITFFVVLLSLGEDGQSFVRMLTGFTSQEDVRNSYEAVRESLAGKVAGCIHMKIDVLRRLAQQ